MVGKVLIPGSFLLLQAGAIQLRDLLAGLDLGGATSLTLEQLVAAHKVRQAAYISAAITRCAPLPFVLQMLCAGQHRRLQGNSSKCCSSRMCACA